MSGEAIWDGIDIAAPRTPQGLVDGKTDTDILNSRQVAGRSVMSWTGADYKFRELRSDIRKKESNSGMAITKRSNTEPSPAELNVHFDTKSTGISRSSDAFALGSSDMRM